MTFIKHISPLHLDVLKEIGNIGAGNAATALSTLLDRKIEMNVPNVKIVSFNEMVELAGGADNVVACVFLRIEGDAPGSMFFVLSMEQATRFVHLMTGDETFSFQTYPYSEFGLSALQELGNILSSSYLSALSDFTNLLLYPSVPALSVDMVGAIIDFGLIKLSQVSDYAIVINTKLKEDGTNDCVEGHFFLLPDPDSFQVIFSALGVSK